MYVCMYERVWAPEIGWPTGRKWHFWTGWSPYRYSSSESERQLSPSHLYVCMYVWEWICNLYYVIICISEYVCMYASPSSGSSHMNSMERRVVFFILGAGGLVGATGSVKFWWQDETETHTYIHTLKKHWHWVTVTTSESNSTEKVSSDQDPIASPGSKQIHGPRAKT